MLSTQVECLVDNLSTEEETCTNSLVWLLSNKTVNKTVYSQLADITRKNFILFHEGQTFYFQ